MTVITHISPRTCLKRKEKYNLNGVEKIIWVNSQILAYHTYNVVV